MPIVSIHINIYKYSYLYTTQDKYNQYITSILLETLEDSLITGRFGIRGYAKYKLSKSIPWNIEILVRDEGKIENEEENED